MRSLCLAVSSLWLASVPVAQEPEFEPGEVVADRVQNGGWFEASRYRRGDDGVLEHFYFADVGGSVPGRFLPLLVLAVVARDDEGAEAWAKRGRELLVEAKENAEREFAGLFDASPELKTLAEALWTADITVKDTAAFATVKVHGLSSAKVCSLAEALATNPW